MIKNVCWFVCCILYSCPILIKLEFSRQIFEKYSNMTFHENPSNGNRVVPCRRSDNANLVVTFFSILRTLQTTTGRVNRTKQMCMAHSSSCWLFNLLPIWVPLLWYKTKAEYTSMPGFYCCLSHPPPPPNSYISLRFQSSTTGTHYYLFRFQKFWTRWVRSNKIQQSSLRVLGNKLSFCERLRASATAYQINNME